MSNVAFKTAWCQNRPSVQLPIRPYSALRLDPGTLGALSRFHGARFVYLEETSIRGAQSHDPLVFSMLRGEDVPGLRAVAGDESSALYEVVPLP